MNKFSLKMMACMAAMMMSQTAQSKTQDVGGRVIDQNGEPLGFVSVALLTADSTYIQGATSDENGAFMIQTTDACCILRLSYIGYHTKYVNVNGSEIGTIQMEQDQTMLNEIVVKGQMPKTKLTGNSMITTIQGTVLGKSGTAKEMLAKVPGMTLKGEDLEVLGKGTPIFYINGRKMQDKEELKRLHSEEIASVEVITNPGAQYDATISSVVRIKTIRREGDGFGFDLNTGFNQDLRFGESDPSAQLNLRYRHNNLDLFGMVNYWKWDLNSQRNDEQSNYLPTDRGVLSIIQKSHSRNHYKNNGIDYNLGFNWQIAENHSVGVRIQRNDRFNATTDLMVITEGRFFCYRAVITKEPSPCMFRSPKCESITEDRIESNLSKTKNIPPKAVIFSDYICTFAMSLMILLVLICSTKVSEKSDMAKSWAIFCYSGT